MIVCNILIMLIPVSFVWSRPQFLGSLRAPVKLHFDFFENNEKTTKVTFKNVATICVGQFEAKERLQWKIKEADFIKHLKRKD